MFEPNDKLLSVLQAAGWLVDEPSVEDKARLIESKRDLLPALSTAARQAAFASASHRSRAPRLEKLLGWLIRRGSKLTCGWPGIPEEVQSRWIGSRLIWWPAGIPDGRKVAWVSSRLGRKLDERPDWFAVLRTAAAKWDRERDVLLTAATTTTDRFLQRAAILFDLRCLRVEAEDRHTLSDWLLRLRRRAWREFLAAERNGESNSAVSGESAFAVSANRPLEASTAAISPLLDSDTSDPNKNCRPLADRLVLLAADHVVALQVRTNGHLHELLRCRLAESFQEPGSVWLAWGDQLVPHDIVNELQSRGAVSWHLQPGGSARPAEPETSAKDAKAIITEWPWADDDYLVHWTRRRTGPWPEQSESNYVDQLLLSDSSEDLSAFAVLGRIARQRQLIASAKNIRGGFRVVSFSATPIRELVARRSFRAHQQRFDFELFGLGLRRDWLIKRGASPVRYGDDSLWPTLPDDERPFFQLRQTRGRHDAAVIDWSLEAEWRVVGNVDLSLAGPHDVVLFVPTEADAKPLSAISPWPIAVLPRPVESTQG